MTEERRKGLEKYVKSIIEADVARWRGSSAWRTLLDLPSGTNVINADGSFSKSQQRDSATGIKNPNQWLDVHRQLRSQIQAARQLLKQREAATIAQQQHRLLAEAKFSLVRAAASIMQLEDGLKSISNASRGDDVGWGGSKKLGEGEIGRRTDLVGAARKEVEGLEGVLRSMATKTATNTAADPGAVATARDKEGQWRGTFVGTKPSGRVLGGPLKETERTQELDNKGVLQLQQQVMQEQDEDVLILGKTVAKLNDMGIMMNEELTRQNGMLSLLEGDTERLQNKIGVGRRWIERLK